MLQAFADVQSGRLPDFPTIEVYTHTSVDAGMTDASGHISAALFVQWVPYQLSQVGGVGCRVQAAAACPLATPGEGGRHIAWVDGAELLLC